MIRGPMVGMGGPFFSIPYVPGSGVWGFCGGPHTLCIGEYRGKVALRHIFKNVGEGIEARDYEKSRK